MGQLKLRLWVTPREYGFFDLLNKKAQMIEGEAPGTINVRIGVLVENAVPHFFIGEEGRQCPDNVDIFEGLFARLISAGLVRPSPGAKEEDKKQPYDIFRYFDWDVRIVEKREPITLNPRVLSVIRLLQHTLMGRAALPEKVDINTLYQILKTLRGKTEAQMHHCIITRVLASCIGQGVAHQRLNILPDKDALANGESWIEVPEFERKEIVIKEAKPRARAPEKKSARTWIFYALSAEKTTFDKLLSSAVFGQYGEHDKTVLDKLLAVGAIKKGQNAYSLKNAGNWILRMIQERKYTGLIKYERLLHLLRQALMFNQVKSISKWQEKHGLSRNHSSIRTLISHRRLCSSKKDPESWVVVPGFEDFIFANSKQKPPATVEAPASARAPTTKEPVAPEHTKADALSPVSPPNATTPSMEQVQMLLKKRRAKIEETSAEIAMLEEYIAAQQRAAALAQKVGQLLKK
jgi:hypothetical protein